MNAEDDMDVARIFGLLFGGTVDVTADEFDYPNNVTGTRISLDGLSLAFDKLSDMTTCTQDSLIGDDYFEHVVDDSRRIPDRYRREMVVEEEHGSEQYRLGGASGAFLLNSLAMMQDVDLAELGERVLGRAVRNARDVHLLGTVSEKQDTVSWRDVIRFALSSPQTVSVQASAKRSPSDLNGLFESFIFHVSYNVGRPLLPRSNSLSSLRSERTRMMRSRGSAKLDVPRRSYVPELVYHYQLGLSSESPVLAFLSFYHVLEHWYENVFLKDMTMIVQDLITGPRFSFKRNDDLKKLIREVTKQAQIRNDEMTFNEEKALMLTLIEYVDLADLTGSIDLVDPTLCSYIESNKVPFSDGRSVNLKDSNINAAYKSLANRIYQTRNSLVHSKDNGKKRFKPFKNDKDLQREAMLLQAVAEQVIIRSSTPR